MFYESELRFLCNTFNKNRISTHIVSPTEPISSIIDPGFLRLFNKEKGLDLSIGSYLNTVEPRTVYRVKDAFGFYYIYLILPDTDDMLFIGPFSNTPHSSRQILEIGEKHGIAPKNQQILENYFNECPYLQESGQLYTMLDTFCELIFGTSYCMIDLERDIIAPPSPINETAHNDSFDDVILGMKTMEKRYNYENELMQIVTLGQVHKVDGILSGLSAHAFEKRSADPVRNSKNYCIIMNTLLRKAAEYGGVHPIYLDKVSSRFALMIEQLPSIAESDKLMREMLVSYCRLSRKHSMKDYSRIVQKTIILIDSDLSANLSLSSLSENQNVSPGYLSTIFKKETGKTITEYIRDKRVKHAMHLLSTTRLQVQTIALHCGIMDVQYFSKTFKKITGKTPKEYRESI